MFSHIVIFWTNPALPDAADELVDGAIKYLKTIPHIIQFHVGKMSPSPRPVVDQTYQVALNLVFPSKAAEQAYQVHPQHIEFVEKVFKRTCQKAVIYDFE
jgi:Stress responsive A/B Barrel Domain